MYSLKSLELIGLSEQTEEWINIEHLFGTYRLPVLTQVKTLTVYHVSNLLTLEEARVFLQLLSKSGEFIIGDQTFCASVGSDGERDLWTLYTVTNETKYRNLSMEYYYSLTMISKLKEALAENQDI